MNKTIRRAGVFTLILVLALLARATWLQVYQAQALADNADNPRLEINEYAQPLGNIIVGGQAVTGSKGSDDDSLKYRRTYSDGPLYAPVTGYTSQVYGATQLEGIYQSVLDGSDPSLQTPLDTLERRSAPGGDVITSIDPEVQKAGYEALGDKEGAAVAIDPSTGRILGMVSTPSYDPSQITGTNDAAAWKALTTDKSQPMLNRALRQPLPPGSTFKLVVASAALMDGLYPNVDTPTDSPNPYTLPDTQTVLTNEESDLPCKNATIRVALQYSCNTVFAHIAYQLGQNKVRAMAEKFGFDQQPDTPVRADASVVPSNMNAPETALAGIGQYDDTATPLQMAMVSAAIENGGKLVTPHMVSKVTDAGGNVLQDPDGQTKTTQVIPAWVASQLQSVMVTVVQHGTGANAKIPGVTVGGKTGTAQHGENNSAVPYAWFTSWANDPATHKQIAVAVVVEQSNTVRAEVSGSLLAGPVAKAMEQAWLQ
ncbi:peptidoglycan D,D-transpeptidase FtsI family protein [Streptomyces gilvus]|uniref:peptidoglycan D,D-transpeptidase FtsI family protein n=1 Tax=Streptomyces gilvus TaxID=2920937 RepID=UPI001F0EF77B|nr:penicillin-binding transpeptidase domain-containing protein [Streptomyces sp. CME 23]MCH5677792.1 penicillin-binding protein 2 [Streptomyces sp. CME 23]